MSSQLEASETTPLLPTSSAQLENNSSVLPSVKPVADRLRREGVQFVNDVSSGELTLAQRTAFGIIVLAELCRASPPTSRHSEGVWDLWSSAVAAAEASALAEKQLIHMWTAFFSEPRTMSEIHQLFFQEFPVDEGNSASIRVADCYDILPSGVVKHAMFTLSMSHFWKNGPYAADLTSRPLLDRVLNKFDNRATPRVLHSLDLLLNLVYIWLLCLFALSPPPQGSEASPQPLTLQAWLLIVYSLSQALRQWSILSVPYWLAFSAALLSGTSTMLFQDIGYSLLLCALSIQILQLHLTFSPSPMFLFPAAYTLPLATVLWHGVSRIFFPVTVFFLPALLLTIFLLSVSLGDVLPFLSTASNVASPLEMRSALAILFVILFALLICSLVILILVYPSTSSRSPPVSAWDRYSDSIGENARRVFARSVVFYSSPYLFLPPFNLLHILFVRLPGLISSTFCKHSRAEAWTLERVLWRLTVGVLACLVSCLWNFNMIS
ncbi:hypothetical protein BDW22DRAFT_1350839 [Trametopsis cervina]|nr:hypothetical protein BDW22DRAFT_1350839 [Trametopsis cervina]